LGARQDMRDLSFEKTIGAKAPTDEKRTCRGLGRVGNHLGLLGKVLGV
jgi:hypothetical protein